MWKIWCAFINDVISKRRDYSGLRIVLKLHLLFSFVLRTLKYVSVIVNLVDNLLRIHWTTLSGTVAIERTSLWVYNRSIKAEVIYDAGLFNCKRLYSSSADHSLFLSIAQCYTHFFNFWYNVMINSYVGDMVNIYNYWRRCQRTKKVFKLNVNNWNIGQLTPNYPTL